MPTILQKGSITKEEYQTLSYTCFESVQTKPKQTQISLCQDHILVFFEISLELLQYPVGTLVDVVHEVYDTDERFNIKKRVRTEICE
jgi:hypothetical protein